MSPSIRRWVPEAPRFRPGVSRTAPTDVVPPERVVLEWPMNKLLLVSTGLVGLLFAAAPASASGVVGCSVPGCSGDVEATGGTTGTTAVGNSGSGTLTITGAYTTGTLIAGSQSGASGTVTVSTGSLTDDAIIGDAGTGTFTNNATHNVTGNLILGNQATGNGTYTITGNSAQTNVNFNTSGNTDPYNGALIVGEFGTGTFTQGLANQSDPGNQVNDAGDLILGHQGSQSSPPVTDSVGTYTLNTGTLTVGGNIGVGGASTANKRRAARDDRHSHTTEPVTYVHSRGVSHGRQQQFE